MYILALGRRKRVGKDVFATHWREGFTDLIYERMTFSGKSFNIDVSRIESSIVIAGFADQLKIDAVGLYGHAGLQSAEFYEQPENEHLRDVVLPDTGSTPRELWISLGMAGRLIRPTYWTDALLDKHLALGTDVLIIKDLRFGNEVDECRVKGTATFYDIENARIPLPLDVADTQDLGQWADAKIINDGTLEQWQITARAWGRKANSWADALVQKYIGGK